MGCHARPNAGAQNATMFKPKHLHPCNWIPASCGDDKLCGNDTLYAGMNRGATALDSCRPAVKVCPVMFLNGIHVIRFLKIRIATLPECRNLYQIRNPITPLMLSTSKHKTIGNDRNYKLKRMLDSIGARGRNRTGTGFSPEGF